MILAAYLPLTLCDYPGKVAAMVFTQGCNFRCPWCHNAHLIPLKGTTPPLDPEVVVQEVAARRRRGIVEAIVVSGGEPTLHSDLSDFLGRCKAAGLAVKLDTNGSRPEVLRTCFDRGLVDFVAMDVKAPWSQYATLAGINVDVESVQTSMRLIAASGLPHQFRTTRVNPLLSESDFTEISAQIPVGSPHVWQTFRPAP
ncbi:MAG: anaerobic ribonucleoside-triphosphate reductase activating protein [Kiritimatiellae bacterium]|nr:anaerobic ribonucleoside-triphosphate reductase activating protein [Kiritimatiellia bacterium]